MLLLLNSMALRPISGAIVQREEGWTAYTSCSASSGRPCRRAATATSPTAAPGSSCGGRALCCKRHPRTADCSHQGRPLAPLLSSKSGFGGGRLNPTILRDDLFLLAPNARASSRDSPVVRSYEACDRDAAFQVEAAANRTRAARAELAATPVPIVAVIFFGAHHDRLPLLRVYERYFAAVVYMSPREEITQMLRSSGGGGSGGRGWRGGRGGLSSPPSSTSRHVRASTYHCKLGLKVIIITLKAQPRPSPTNQSRRTWRARARVSARTSPVCDSRVSR